MPLFAFIRRALLVCLIVLVYIVGKVTLGAVVLLKWFHKDGWVFLHML